MNKIFFLLFLSFGILSFAQNHSLSGVVLDESDYPIENVEVKVNNTSTSTDKNGEFNLEISESDLQSSLIFSKENFQSFNVKINPTQKKYQVKLLTSNEVKLKEVIFQKQRKTDLSSISIQTDNLSKAVSISGGVEDVLKTLPYVNSNTELSSQYMVRGGNYDENLVYINGIEMYRPFLVRSGQQEGLSVVNPSMTSLLNFSAGGFEAKYGDRMSSVLDITYKKPKKFEASIEASLIGGSATIGFADKKQKFSAIFGARYRNTNFLLKTFDTDTDFNPIFADFQTYITYKFNPKWNIAFTGNISQNRFDMTPRTRETDFGSLTNPLRLKVFYFGQEKDEFLTKNANLSIHYKPIKNLQLSSDFYVYHGTEQEYFTISSAYFIQEVDPVSGNTTSSIDAGRQRDHARNDLDFLVLGTQLRGKYSLSSNSSIESGIQFQKEDVRDFLNEWQFLENGGYNFPFPADFDANLKLNYHIYSRQNLSTNRIMGFLQWNKKFFWNENKVMINSGIRYQNWDFNQQNLISPRVQIALKPNWKSDFLFRFATGIYYQSPIFKELRALDGTLNQNIKAQKSIHFIFGTDYEFKLKERPFKFTTEIYYKNLDDLIPYYVDNVRIKYTAQNNSIGRSYGIDTRLNGEFIKNAESWISLSYARTEENIDNQGWIPRPTDQRLRAALFFQDYMKFFPSMKVNVHLVYASGLPNGAPLFSNPYNYQSTLPSYKRVDIGFTKVFVDSSKKVYNSSFWKNFTEVAIGVEAFNVFNIKNTISNQWVRDFNTNLSYAVPNRLTGRFFNVKLYVSF
jgi:hypothetical protein